MPRATRLMPIAMPTGIAVMQATKKAVKTRNMLAAKCCQSGLSLAFPVRYSTNCSRTACGFGRKSGLTQPMLVTKNQSATSVTTVATLMTTLEPSPGTLNLLVFIAARSVAGGTANGEGIGTMLAAWASRSGMRGITDGRRMLGFAVVDDCEHLFAQADEFWLRFHLARIASAQKLAREGHVVVDVRDAAGARAHDDEAGRQEERFFHRVRDEEDHLVRRRPGVQQDLLHLLAREGVERAHRFVHQQYLGVVGQGAGDADALLHPARKLVDRALGIFLEADQGQLFVGDLASCSAADPTQAQAERDVVAHREPWHQRVLLEDDAAVGAVFQKHTLMPWLS